MAVAESGTLSSYGKGGQQRELYGRFQGSVRRYSLSYSAVCDNYAYEYTDLKHRLDIPMLMVETDATKQCEGQIRTRVEAFIESLKIAKGASIGKKSLKKAEDGKMYVLGIDSGSTSTNAVILMRIKKSWLLMLSVLGRKAARVRREFCRKFLKEPD